MPDRLKPRDEQLLHRILAADLNRQRRMCTQLLAGAALVAIITLVAMPAHVAWLGWSMAALLLLLSGVRAGYCRPYGIIRHLADKAQVHGKDGAVDFLPSDS